MIAPQNLVLAFDRVAESKRYKLMMLLEIDYHRYVQASDEKTTYRLVLVVKKLKSGMHASLGCMRSWSRVASCVCLG
jgi:hypothetical protein